jgi:eukaryotic-like serine/threonine-protein kinase
MAVDVDLLPARYRGPQQIGRGGMGEIFRATDSVLGRAVAIKILGARYAEDDAIRERFTREALAAARLSGEPNIITIYDVGDHNSRPYIVMEYLSGGSLETRLRGSRAQPTEQVCVWLEQAARALDAAHREGVVHRDVKPANLLLDRSNNVHVADFGIASAAGLDSLTATGTILGTAGYLSPEQAKGERATPASDRYALAIVAFELLTGHRPFESESVTAEAAAHVNNPVPSVCDKLDWLPCELDPVFHRALAKDPAARYPSCSEFVADLRAALHEAAGQTRIAEPAAAAPPPTAPPAPYHYVRPPRRTWPLLAAMLVAAGIAGAILAVVLTGGNEPKRAAVPQPRITTVERTVPRAGEVTTIPRTVTATPPAASTPAPRTPSGESGATLNDRGYALMRQGRYTEALPLFEQAYRKLQGSGAIAEAYTAYNLAYSRYKLGNCNGVLALLDHSQAIQGHRAEIDQLRRDASQRCA